MIVVIGVAEVAYQREIRKKLRTSLQELMTTAVANGPSGVENMLRTLQALPISHDVHFDMEESNSKSSLS